ncbi:FAD-dependent oxidoreductase [Microbacterium sp. 2FI]|uniref:FAD-dependent oxidoreductase n=1 Tax=Microbacterium sp. 2FI TaxID=2502193 RepID=UPI0010FA50E1|nr:FAD-dependent oxidoreductase [Microbacterium sp. 2FI]
MNTWDAIVIGAGAAGLSAAQMLGRARRRTLVLDTGAPRNRFAPHMHGVLGHDGMSPGDLLGRGRAEVEAYDVEVRAVAVARVDEGATRVTVTLADGSAESARALVLATGVSDDLPDIPGLAERWGTGVLHCPYCHGWEVRDRRLGVLLVSPHQLHQAQLVRQWSDDVVVFAGMLGAIDPEIARRLHARGVEIVAEPVVEVVGEGTEVTGVRLRDGRVVAVGALFTMGAVRPHDAFVAHLGLARADTPVGSFLEVDAMGRTSSARIWAAGNVVSPMANVPLSMGAGAMAGAAVNAALVEEDFDLAPALYWNGRYADRLWSGRPNRTMVDVVQGLEPGRALDLGCGEGADAIWLAQQGWDATGVDISQTAIDRAQDAARTASIDAHFVVSDLSEAETVGEYDLVTASFFHSPVALDRTGALRRAAARVAPGGRMLIVSHAGPPPWAPAGHGGAHVFLNAADELDALGLDDSDWMVEIAEARPRGATAPDGTSATLDDTVLLVHRRPDVRISSS